MDKKNINDEFHLYDLEVETIESLKDHVCNHTVGSSFKVEGENLIFSKNTSFSLYALSAIIPLLPAKQRDTAKNDWMTTDDIIACPDPNCGGRFKITRISKRKFRHSETTATPLNEK